MSLVALWTMIPTVLMSLSTHREHLFFVYQVTELSTQPRKSPCCHHRFHYSCAPDLPLHLASSSCVKVSVSPPPAFAFLLLCVLGICATECSVWYILRSWCYVCIFFLSSKCDWGILYRLNPGLFSYLFSCKSLFYVSGEWEGHASTLLGTKLS